MLRKILIGLAGLFVAWLLFLRPRQPLIYIPDSGPRVRHMPEPTASARAEGNPSAPPQPAPAAANRPAQRQWAASCQFCGRSLGSCM